MTTADFRRIAERVERDLGILLREHKRQMVYSRLARRVRTCGFTSFGDYLAYLDRPESGAEREHFANAVTTNLTSFFREAHHFAHLEGDLLSRSAAAHGGRFRIWSAGCSTGEEPYSVAMLLRARPGVLAGRDIRVLATDLDTEALATAEAGRFSVERLRGLPPRYRSPDFLQPVPGGFAVAEPVRRLVTFRSLNLIGPWPMRGPFDVIFCRNVLIYFSTEGKARAIDRFARLLRPGGVLYLGHSESLLGQHPQLVPEGPTIYRRTERA